MSDESKIKEWSPTLNLWVTSERTEWSQSREIPAQVRTCSHLSISHLSRKQLTLVWAGFIFNGFITENVPSTPLINRDGRA